MTKITRHQHPKAAQLAEFGLGRLGEADSLRIEQHLAECNACTRAVADAPPDGIIALLRDGAVAAASTPVLRLHAGYEILEELGRGGIGVVYKARQRGTGRIVALKRLGRGSAASAEDLSRFRLEAEAAGRLQHPQIIRVYDFGEQDGEPYLALEYVAGESLAKVLTRSQPDAETAARLIETLARAVHYAHQQCIVHRDLKPANVLLERGSPKIADFGMAKRLDDAGQTQTGAILGTPSYMAPEQASGSKEVGPPADIYALGAILYELLTGRPPFRAATTLETLEQVRHQEPVAPSRITPRISRDLETICLKCLRKEPGQRYANAESLAEDLRRFQAGEAIEARRATPIERALKWARRKPAAALALSMAILAAFGAVGGLVWHNHRLRSEVKRAELGEADARRQKAQAMANFDLGHESIDEMVLNLIQTIDDWDDPYAQGMRREQAAIAVRYYDKAFQDADPADPEIQLVRGKNLTYSAYLETVLDRNSTAADKYEQAIALLEGLSLANPGNAEYQRELGFCRYRYGYSLMEQHASSEAEIQLLQALQLFLRVTPSDQGHASKPWLLGLCYLQLTKLCTLNKKWPAAEEYGQSGVAFWRQVVEGDPQNSKVRYHLADMLHCLADVLRARDKVDDYLDATRESIAVLQLIRHRHGVDFYTVRGRYLLGDAYFRAASLEYTKDQNNEQAKTDASAGIEVIELLLKDDPHSAMSRACLYGLYRCRAFVTAELDDQLADWDKALAAADGDLQHGCRIERAQAYAAAGEYRRIADEVQVLVRDPKVSADQLFAAAACYGCCVAALDDPAVSSDPDLVRLEQSYVAEALTCLRRWQSAGGLRNARRLNELADLPAFASLRIRSEFQNWLRTAKP